MTITAKSCADFLREHNDWRRGGEGNLQTPFEIGRHIDFAIESLDQAADIATIEQESRQMRARMERLEAELETERALSFRNQVAELEQQRDELLAALEDVKIYLQDTQAQRHIYDRVIKAIARVKGGAE